MSEGQPAPAEVTTLPVAAVLVDMPLPHLDKPFDYAVPDSMLGTAVPGSRVRVRFAGRLVDGFVLERRAGSDHPGRLAALVRVTSPEPVLTPEVAALCRAVADRWVGSCSDVLRLAVPARHARVEKAEQPEPPQVGAASPAAPPFPAADATAWQAYQGGSGLVAALAGRGAGPGAGPRAVWTAAPGEDWPARWAELAAATQSAGQGTVLVVPDQRDLARVSAAMRTRLGPESFVSLSADLGPAERYRRFLSVSRGQVRVVVGTRAACYAPVADLGLVGIWDDGDDLHCEPHAPYPHSRDVLLLRAHLAQCAAVVGGWARTAEGQRLVSRGWARDVVPHREALRARAPRVVTADDDVAVARDSAGAAARLPHVAFTAVREALARDEPVLVQVPRRGYRAGLSCASCRAPARCPVCSGSLQQASSHALPACGWCGRPAADWTCSRCGSQRCRYAVLGTARTVEELGRAFPQVPVRQSVSPHVLAAVPGEASLVVATPGAEPATASGYGACLLLDAWLLLGMPGLRAGEETLRRWLGAAAQVRPSGSGGTVVVSADPSVRQVQALVRWDPQWAAARELEERQELRFPPAAALVSLTGTAAAVAELVEVSEVERSTPGVELLGPVVTGEAGESERMLVRAPLAGLSAVAAALRGGQGMRSARKARDAVRVQVDPYDLL